MSAQSIQTQVVGKIVPIGSGTRLRILPSTYTTVLGSYGPADQVEIDLTILYTETDPVQPATMKNDLWGRVVKINDIPLAQIRDINGNLIVGSAYMAIDYHGVPICTKHYTEGATPPPEESPFVSATLRRADGSTVEFVPKV